MERQCLARDLQGWVMSWEKGWLWFSPRSSWFAHLLIPDCLGFSPSSCFLPTLACIPPLLPKQILITYWRASPMSFQLCQGALEPLCSPAGDACCYYPALLLACASWFEGKHYAVLCYRVTQMNHFPDKRCTQNQRHEQPARTAGSSCTRWSWLGGICIEP